MPVTPRGVTPVTSPRAVTGAVTGPVTRPLVLSLFPGIDLLGRAFREAGCVVVTGPDPIVGSRIEDFVGLSGRFDGIIAGPACQDFSRARRAAKPSGHGLHCLAELIRVILECRPPWWLVENVPGIPDLEIPGYAVQRLDLTDRECGGLQRRLRHIQFGHAEGWIIRPDRHEVRHGGRPAPTAMATDAYRRLRTFPEHCRLQGLDRPVTLAGWSREAKFRAVGNGVPMAMGRVLAVAVLAASPRDPAGTDCVCGCGRRVTPPAIQATAACRKRMERRRRGTRSVVTPSGLRPGRRRVVTRVTEPGTVTSAQHAGNGEGADG